MCSFKISHIPTMKKNIMRKKTCPKTNNSKTCNTQQPFFYAKLSNNFKYF